MSSPLVRSNVECRKVRRAARLVIPEASLMTGGFANSSGRITQVECVIAEEHWHDRTIQKPFRVEYEVGTGELVKSR